MVHVRRYHKCVQECVLSWDDYRLDVRWGGALAYSVHVFLLRGPNTAHMVEFRRGGVDIFQFKRHYEQVQHPFVLCFTSLKIS